MAPWNFLIKLIKPVTELVDDLHTSEEERLLIKAKLFEMQSEMASQVMDYEARLLEAKTKVVTAEAQGAGWMQRNWRPLTMLTFLGLVVAAGLSSSESGSLTMLTFLGLVVADSFGLTQFRLAHEAWILLEIGLGGYVVGRSAEKIIPKITEVMRKE